MAVLTAPMQGQHNASDCLVNAPSRGKRCDPIGGHSVLATLPPLAPGRAKGDGWVLVTAGGDAPGGLFHDAAVVRVLLSWFVCFFPRLLLCEFSLFVCCLVCVWFLMSVLIDVPLTPVHCTNGNAA